MSVPHVSNLHSCNRMLSLLEVEVCFNLSLRYAGWWPENHTALLLRCRERHVRGGGEP